MSSLVDDQFWQLLETVAATQAAPLPTPGSQTARRPQSLHRNPIRAHDRDRLAAAAAGARLRLRHDLLAAPPGVAAGRRLRPSAPTSSRQAAASRPARPLLRRLRLLLAARAFGGDKTGPSPVDRARAGSKHHLITDAQGIPLACLLTAANRPDVTQLLPLLEAIPPIRGKRGRPRHRPDALLADPRLRLPTPQAPTPRPRHHTAHRHAQHAARLRTRQPTLGRRTHPLLATPIPTPTHPLRTPRPDPRSLPRPGLQPHLLPVQQVV
jgi:DDE family transposase